MRDGSTERNGGGVITSQFEIRGTRRHRAGGAGLTVLVVTLLGWLAGVDSADGQYPTYAQIEAELLATEDAYPQLCRIYNLGQTVQGRSMWALCITDNVGVEEDEPEFRYISTMHGDEVMGVEMCLNLIDYLTAGYGTDSRVTNLVDSVELWIIPCMNPDGYVAGRRWNQNNVDLNRDFPDPFTSPANSTAGRQPETANVMNWAFGRSFTLGANYHGGALVANYPFDNNATGSSVYTPTPDDDLFIWISEEYARNNLPMWNSGVFFHGITNGADWYAIAGGMQDWSYRYMNTNEVTIEVSEVKTPPASQIPSFWDDNRESMLAFIETALVGVRGIVTDASTGAPLGATVTLIGRENGVSTDPDVGDYHRMVLPGTYDLMYEAPAHDTRTVYNVSVAPGPATRVDVTLWSTVVTFPNGGETLAKLEATEIVWVGDPTRPFQVQYTENADDVTVTTDGYEAGVLDPAYATGGHQNWTVSSSNSSEGTYAVRSGAIADNQATWLARTVEGDHVRFRYLVSSEAGYDFFNFYVDADRRIHASGTGSGWLDYETTLTPGSHALMWEYVKDGSVLDGSDAVWIDELQITGENTLWADVVALTAVGASSAPWTPTSDGRRHRVRVRSYGGLGDYGPWDESDATFAVGEPAPIPTLSEWGLLAMTLLLLASGTVVARHRPQAVLLPQGGTAVAGRKEVCDDQT